MNHVGCLDVSQQFGIFLAKDFRRFEFTSFQIAFEKAIQRARNMSCHRIERFILSMKAIGRARIDDCFALRCKIIKNLIDQNQSLVRHRFRFFFKRSRGHYCSADLPLPGFQSAIQHLHLVMTDRPQHPPQAAGKGRALAVIGDHMGIGGYTQALPCRCPIIGIWQRVAPIGPGFAA